MEETTRKIDKYNSKNTINVLQKFRWNIISTSEEFNNQRGLFELILTLKRDTEIHNYEEIVKLEHEYYSLSVNYPKLFPLGSFLKEAWFWVIILFPFILIYWVYNFFAKYQPNASIVSKNIKRRNEILTELEQL